MSKNIWLVLISSVLFLISCAGNRKAEISVVPPDTHALKPGSTVPVSVTASSTDYGIFKVCNIGNGAGLFLNNDGELTHGTAVRQTMWRTPRGVTGKISLQFDLGTSLPVGKMEVWNYNPAGANSEDTGTGIKSIRIFYSLDGISWEELTGPGYPYQLEKASGINNLTATNLVGTNEPVDFNNINAQYIKLVVPTEPEVGNWGGDGKSKRVFGLSEVRFSLGEGFAVLPADEWTGLLKRYNGWAGADGIFSIPLSGGKEFSRGIEERTLFLFSDTFIGHVNPALDTRQGNHMVNNTLALLEDETPLPRNIEFIWGQAGDYSLESVFSPRIPIEDSPVGSAAVNLTNDSGMSGRSAKTDIHENDSSESMWLSARNPEGEISLEFDFSGSYPLGEMWVWNYNEHLDYRDGLHRWGLKDTRIYYSDGGDKWTELKGNGYPYQLAEADGSGELAATNLNDGNNSPVSFDGIKTRYVKIVFSAEPGVGNWGGVPGEEDRYGLSEVRFYTPEGRKLFSQTTAGSTDHSLSHRAESSRYWLQDGTVIDGMLYLFPLLVQDSITEAGGMGFAVKDVHMIQVPVSGGELMLDESKRYDTPLSFTEESTGKEFFFGCGVMDNRRGNGGFDPDGYIYIYGYTNQGAHKNLIAARTLPENMADFNTWNFWNGSNWTLDMEDAAAIAAGVSAELSVAPQTDGLFKDRYLLIYMKDTISGVICYRTAPSPEGPFSETREIYFAPESLQGTTVFTYNAKAHPHLSKKGGVLVSYNVNSTDTAAFNDADIYRPRFIRLIDTSLQK